MELLPVAIRLESAPQSPVAALGSSLQMAQGIFLEAALESFPVLAFLFLFWLLLLSQLFCLLMMRFSFAIFSCPFVLASESGTFSISL